MHERHHTLPGSSLPTPGNTPDVHLTRGGLPRIRVLLAGAQMTTQALSNVLQSDFEVTTCTPDGDLVDAASRQQPRAIVIDLDLSCQTALEAAARVRHRQPAIPVVFVMNCAHGADVRVAYAVGAAAYVSKTDTVESLRHALKEVLRGRSYMSKRVQMLLHEMHGNQRAASPLTARQEQVLDLVALGKTRKEIAEILHISPKTVEFHKARIMRLLGLYTTAALTRYCLSRGSGNTQTTTSRLMGKGMAARSATLPLRRTRELRELLLSLKATYRQLGCSLVHRFPRLRLIESISMKRMCTGVTTILGPWLLLNLNAIRCGHGFCEQLRYSNRLGSHSTALRKTAQIPAGC